MDDFASMIHDPRHHATFEKLLRIAAKKGDADIVRERLSWGIDPNAASKKKGVTALIGNVRCCCPNAATVKALLQAGADPTLTDFRGLTALDYARRKLLKLSAKPREPQHKSPSLDENDQLQLGPQEQEFLDEMRQAMPPEDRKEFMQLYLQERLRAARRTFNDIDEVEMIVELLEAAAKGAG